MANEFKLSYTAADINARLGKIDNLANKNELPTKTSDLINDSDFADKDYVKNYAQPINDYALKSEIPTDYLTEIPEGYITETELNAKGYLTGFTETDPTVPAWAKAANKPTYTKSEIGLVNVDNVRQYSVENPPIVVRSEAPEDTNVLWLDPDDNNGNSGGSVDLEDYATEQWVIEELAKRSQLKPEFAESEDWLRDNGDQTKLYVLPTGYIYAYMDHAEEVVIPGETVAIPAKVAVLIKQRYSLSSAAFTSSAYSMVVVPLKLGVTSLNIVLDGVVNPSTYKNAYLGHSANNFTVDLGYFGELGSGTTSEYSFNNDNIGSYEYVCFNIESTSETDIENAKITVNGESMEFVVTTDPTIASLAKTETLDDTIETIVTEGFVNTGLAFIPADYEDRILELEKKVTGFNGSPTVTDESVNIHNMVGTSYPPSQKPATTDIDGYDIDILNSTADDIHAYIDEIVNGKNTVTKEVMGKEESGNFDIVRYTYANRDHIAWVRQNYPKMYAWKNGNTVIYSESISPRIGDNMYVAPVIGEKYGSQGGTSTEVVTVPGKAVIIRGQRYSGSSGAFVEETTCASLVIPTEFKPDGAGGATKHTLVLNNATLHQQRTGFYIGDDKLTFPRNGNMTKAATAKTATLGGSGTVDYGQKYAILFLAYDGSQTFADTTVTMDGVSLDIIVTNSTADSVKAAHATTKEVEVGTEAVHATVTAVSAAKRSRTINGLEFIRYADGDVEPTVIYTDTDDERNNNATITQDGVTYNRYPLGDLGANRKKLIPVFIYANEHGIYPAAINEGHESYNKYETKMCALVAARILRDFVANKQAKNPLYKYIRENCMLIVIPVTNPYGFNLNVTEPNTARNGYVNYNRCNINRNYDCPGWDVMNPTGSTVEFGEYPGSENETQYVMNTMVESGAVVAMSLHGLGGWSGYCAHQGQSPDGSDYNREKLARVNQFLQSNYGYTLRYYDLNADGTPAVAVNTPDKTSKSPSYITQCGAYGGIVEFSPDDVTVSGFKQEMKSNVIENAYAQTLNLMAMWLSDYLEQKA